MQPFAIKTAGYQSHVCHNVLLLGLENFLFLHLLTEHKSAALGVSQNLVGVVQVKHLLDNCTEITKTHNILTTKYNRTSSNKPTYFDNCRKRVYLGCQTPTPPVGVSLGIVCSLIFMMFASCSCQTFQSLSYPRQVNLISI